MMNTGDKARNIANRILGKDIGGNSMNGKMRPQRPCMNGMNDKNDKYDIRITRQGKQVLSAKVDKSEAIGMLPKKLQNMLR